MINSVEITLSMEDIQIKVEVMVASATLTSNPSEVAVVVASITSTCNQQMKYSETFSVVKIHLPTFLMMMMIYSVEADSETWVVSDKWAECMIIWDLDKWECNKCKWVEDNNNEIRNSDDKEEPKRTSKKTIEWVEWGWALALMMMTFLVEEWVVV